MKHLKQFIAAILLLALLVQMLPTTALAVSSESSAPSAITDVIANDVAELSQMSPDPSYILGEVESLRSKSEKHFRMADGSYIAVSYGQPVHFQDPDGHWQDIDNTLTRTSADAQTVTKDKAQSMYTAQNGTETRRFAVTYQPDSPIFIAEHGEYSIAMSVLVPQSKNLVPQSAETAVSTSVLSPAEESMRIAAAVDNPAPIAAQAAKQLPLTEQTAPQKLSSTVTYPNLWQDTNLIYQTSGHNVKETILVAKPQSAYEYNFRLCLSGLTPLPQEDGSILLANENNAPVYRIPAPYMEDANGACSDAVDYKLSQDGEDWLLTVLPDEAWLSQEERAFPVAIDPSIYLEGDSSNKNIITSYVAQNHKLNLNNILDEKYKANRHEVIRCGYYNNTANDSTSIGKTVGLIYVNQLPAVPSGAVITNAYLNLYQTKYGGIGSYNFPKIYTSVINANYKNIETFLDNLPWNLLSEIAYGTGTEPIALDYVKASDASTGRDICWGITPAVQAWYAEEPGKTPEISRLLVLDDKASGTTNA